MDENKFHASDKFERMRNGEKIPCKCGKGYIYAVGENKKASNYFRCDACGLHMIFRVNVDMPDKWS